MARECIFPCYIKMHSNTQIAIEYVFDRSIVLKLIILKLKFQVFQGYKNTYQWRHLHSNETAYQFNVNQYHYPEFNQII